MELKQHPLSAADLARCSWNGVAHRPSLREVTVRTLLSAKHPGFVHYEVCDLEHWTRAWSKLPVTPDFAIAALALETGRIGLELADFTWSEGEVGALDWQASESPDAACEFVYFIQAGPFIKIGKTNGRPGARIPELQTGCPYELELVAHLPGGIELERKLHADFSRLHVRGEWFRHERELVDFVRGIA